MGEQTPQRLSLASLPEIGTPAALIAVAVALQDEAARRYATLAGEQRQRGNAAAADLFERLAREKGERGPAIAHWGESQGLGVVEPVAVEWEPLEADDEEPPPGLGPDSPYRALALAVRGEDRAFRFYSYVAATAEDETVGALAERLAKEDLAHAALLRARRRRAFHVERREADPGSLPDPSAVTALADLLAAAAAIEERLADRLAEAAPRAAQLLPISKDARRLADALAGEVDEAGEPRPAIVRALRDLAGTTGRTGAAAEGGGDPLPRALADSEAAFAFYDAVVTAAAGEAVMLKAQDLSRSALERLSALAALTRPA